jgi:hypothetical protein
MFDRLGDQILIGMQQAADHHSLPVRMDAAGL